MDDELLEYGYRFHVQFHVTNACNLRCKHCYEGGCPSIVEWGYGDFIKAIDSLWSCFQKWGVLGEISIIGGEPTLHPDFIKMVDYLGHRQDVVAISILTNGVRLTSEQIDLFKRNNCYVQISIDGVTKSAHDYIRGNGNYDRAIESLKKLKEEGIKTSVHFVLSKYTYPLSENFFEMLVENGVKRVSFSRIVPFGNAKVDDMLSASETRETYDFINRMKEKFSESDLHVSSTRPLWCNFGYSGKCPVAIQTITVLENGDIMPCRRLPIVIGNIKKDNFYKIWYTDDTLNKLRDRSAIEKCGKCKFVNDCGGGRCLAYAVYGDYMRKDPQCWL